MKRVRNAAEDVGGGTSESAFFPTHVSSHLNEQQREACRSFLTLADGDGGLGYFLTGAAGTGKGEVIKEITNLLRAPPFNLRKNRDFFVTATTGTAAKLVNGITVYSFAGIGRGEGSPDQYMREFYQKPWKMRKWKTCQYLIIDEISLLNAKTFDLLDSVARRVRKTASFMGGLKVLLVGDFLQLPPVDGEFAYTSPTWRQNVTHNAVLTENMRARRSALSKTWNDVLCDIRLGKCTDRVKNFIESRCIQPPEGEEPTCLMPVNRAVDAINEEKLAALLEKGPEDCLKEYTSRVSFSGGTQNQRDVQKEIMPKGVPAESHIRLCVGCRVVLLINLDVKRGLTNGALGTIVDFATNNDPYVKFDCIEHPCRVSRHVWEESVSEKFTAYLAQMPLKLAWALNVHKSQGMSLDTIFCDLGPRVFAEGMAYVSLSRSKFPERVYVSDFDPASIRCDASAREFYENLQVTQ